MGLPRRNPSHLKKGDVLVTKAMLSFGGVVLDPYMIKRDCNVVREQRFVVAWDGRCTPCSLDGNLAMAAGDLNTQSVKEIIWSPAWGQALRDITQRAGICANCFDAQNYGGVAYTC